jgi:acetyltransferase-like isoleucine patch superfamily enzyme
MLSHAVMLSRRLLGGAKGINWRAYVHYSAQISEQEPGQILIGRGAHIGKHAWLNVACPNKTEKSPLQIGARAHIGRNSLITAINQIIIGPNVLTGPQVLIMDHNHEFSDVNVPILDQGVTEGGRIILEEGCWIGFGAAIMCNSGVLRIGRNSVVGANSVVTKDVEPATVVVGAPARAVRRYDASANCWKRIDDSQAE